MGLRALRRAAIERFDFRAQRPMETDAAYFRALQQYVAVRDLAAGFELRVGRPQAEWSPGDMQAFHDHTVRLQGPSMEFEPGLHGFPVMEDPGPYPVTDEGVMRLAERGLDATMAMRRDNATRELAPIAAVLLDDGRVLAAAVTSGDRLAFLKFLTRTYPVFGFLLTFDAYMHGITKNPVTLEVERVTKRDAIITHCGTRTMRRGLVRFYTVTNGMAIFDDNSKSPLTDLDFRDGGHEVMDPYAELFVSVPTVESPQ